MTPFGKACRIVRMERGETLKHWAQMINMSSAYVSVVEIGKRTLTPNHVKKIVSLIPLSKEERATITSAAAETLFTW